MARPTTTKRPLRFENGFDVNCTIGRVEFDESAERGISPYAAAMQLIAEHDADGSYSFPNPFGGTVTVTVEGTNERGEA